MIKKRGRIISGSPERAEMTNTHPCRLALPIALLLAACGAEPSAATANGPPVTPVAADVETSTPPAQGDGKLTLAGPAGSEAIAAIPAEATPQGMKQVEIAGSQSFRVMDGSRQVATLITGEGDMPDVQNAGCFVAVSQSGNVELIPTIGYGDYDAETCGGAVAVGLLSSGAKVRIGAIFRASSPSVELTEPLVIDWDRSDGTLLIDTTVSRRVLDRGAQTIAAMRKLVR
jgi:hypothetical protein